MTFDLIFAVAAPAAKAAAPQGWQAMLRGGQLPFNWFDIAVFIVLLIGFTRGRKHGMSEEMMYLTQWIAMIFGAAFAFKPGGDFIVSSCPLSHLTSYIIAYITAAIVIKMLFALLKRAVGGKLIGSNMFGAAEYYLGMVAGILRFACILIFALALLNARLYSAAEIKARDKYNTEVYGSNFFPELMDVQREVFNLSFVGPQVKKYVPFLLIPATAPENRGVQRAKEFELK